MTPPSSQNNQLSGTSASIPSASASELPIKPSEARRTRRTADELAQQEAQAVGGGKRMRKVQFAQ